jgi:hypothetical protein
MTATYEPSLPDDRDHVRFLIRDTDTTAPMFQDEEIDAVLSATLATVTSPAARYFAAATLLAALHTQWMSRGKGIASKKTSKFAITYGTGIGINVDAAVQARIKELRRQGADILCPSPKTLAMI